MEGSPTLKTGVVCHLFKSDGNLPEEMGKMKMFDKWEQIECAQSLSMMFEIPSHPGPEAMSVCQLTSLFKMCDAEHATEEMNLLPRRAECVK